MSNDNNAKTTSLRVELTEAIATGKSLLEEHPMLLHAHWLEWHTKAYWSILNGIGIKAADAFEKAGGGLHQGAAKVTDQLAVLEHLYDELP